MPLGLTWAPDAVTLGLPPPSSFRTSSASSSRGSPNSSPLDTVGSSCDADDTSSSSGPGNDGRSAAEPEPPARHVLVLACDGLWDVVGNEEAVSIAQR